MKLKNLIAICLLVCGAFGSLAAQGMKIGYANIEAILVRMPETKAMNDDLVLFEKKLAEKLQTKQNYAQTKLEEYGELVAPFQQNPNLQPTEEQLAQIQGMEQELQKLQQEIQEEQAKAQEQLMTRRQDKLQPIIERIQAQIDAVSEAEGYDYIFNTVDGSGVSILLKGPEEHDLTVKIMTKLGIQIPEGN